jgi:hypothetical protein
MRDMPRKVSTVLGTLACLLLLLHIALALLVIVWPEISKSNRVLSFYRRFVVLGPFFQESRIVSAPHLLISQYANGVWSAGTDFACERVAGGAGKYESLRYQSFENFLAARAASAKQGDGRQHAERELENYFKSRLGFSKADSLSLTYVRRGTVGAMVYVDTIYQHKFKR